MLRTCFKLWLLVACLNAPFAAAKVVGLFDFDGTLVRDRGPGAAWITPWILKRVEQMHSTFQQSSGGPVLVTLNSPEQIAYYNNRYKTDLPLDQPAHVSLELPEQIRVSYDEYYKYQLGFAKAESSLGNLNPVLLNYDPMFPERQRLIVPGYYRTFDLTFKYYREGTGSRPKNYLMQDLRSARERAKLLGDDYTWKGPAFELFQSLMASTETAKDVQIFTSRGQAIREHRSLWQHLAAEGDIQNFRGPNGQWPIVHALGKPEARIYGRTLGEKKVDVVRNVLQSLYHSAGEKHLELDSEGRLAKMHTLIVAEDEPSYIDEIVKYLVGMSGGYYSHRVKMVLLNSGSDEEVRAARFPHRWTVFLPGRHVRAATEDEIALWTNPESLKVSRMDCAEVLAPGIIK